MVWSHDTGQQIACSDSCQFIIAWMPKIKDVAMVMVLPSYFARYWHTDICADIHLVSHGTTKIFKFDGLPDFLRYGAPLAHLSSTATKELSTNQTLRSVKQLGTYQCSPCRMLFYPFLKATETTNKLKINNLLSRSLLFISHWIRLDSAIIR